MQCAAFRQLAALPPLRHANTPLDCRQQLPSTCAEKLFLECKRTGDTMQDWWDRPGHAQPGSRPLSNLLQVA